MITPSRTGQINQRWLLHRSGENTRETPQRCPQSLTSKDKNRFNRREDAVVKVEKEVVTWFCNPTICTCCTFRYAVCIYFALTNHKTRILWGHKKVYIYRKKRFTVAEIVFLWRNKTRPEISRNTHFLWNQFAAWADIFAINDKQSPLSL